MNWATLTEVSEAERTQWISDVSNNVDPLLADSPLDSTALKRRKRRWAELAFSFRALSRPVGIAPLEASDVAGSLDVRRIAGDGGFGWLNREQFQSHTFMTTKPLSHVWPLFTHIARTSSQ